MTVEAILAIIGAVVPLASAIASALNQHVRTAEAPAPATLKAAVVANVLAVNADKVKQLAGIIRAAKK